MAGEDKKLILAGAMGFCGGVRAALATLDKLVETHKDVPVCVLHELVHNRHVNEAFARRGVVFLNDLEELPRGAVLLLGAPGVPTETERRARELASLVVDTTCPLVKARQLGAAELGAKDTLVLIGHPRHPEVLGIVGRSRAGRNFVVSSAAEAEKIELASPPVLLAQTTFDAFELARCRAVFERRFPDSTFLWGVCRASQERQDAVARLAREVEVVVVAGSPHSSNARRLCETAGRCGARGVMVESASDLPPEVFQRRRVGLTSGASTPDGDVDEIAAAFSAAGFKMEKQSPEKEK